MRKLLVPLTLAATLGIAGAASAATSTGAIQAINLGQLTVTLADGTVYTFDKTAMSKEKLINFKVGDRVSINWIEVGTAHRADAISPAVSSDMDMDSDAQ